MALNTIHLHGISAEIRRVQEQLRDAKVQAAPSDLPYLDLKIAQLEELQGSTRMLCPKGQGVWGETIAVSAPTEPVRGSEADEAR
jgi:hypothetical protein